MPGRFFAICRSFIRLARRKPLLPVFFVLAAFLVAGDYLVQVIARRAAATSPSALKQNRNRQPQIAGAGQIGERALNQIQALIREKSSRTPAQRKLDVAILDTARMKRGETIAPGVPRLQTNVEVSADNSILVNISAEVTDNLLR